MKYLHTFTHEYEGDENDEYDTLKVSISTDAVTVTALLEVFEAYLSACGFVVKPGAISHEVPDSPRPR